MFEPDAAPPPPLAVATEGCPGSAVELAAAAALLDTEPPAPLDGFGRPPGTGAPLVEKCVPEPPRPATAAATSSRPAPKLADRPFFAVASTRSTACCGVRPRASRSAIAPATCGAAIDVPASYAYWFVLPATQYVERISSCGGLKFGSAPPGAAIPHRAPLLPLAYVASASFLSVAVTTMAWVFGL